MFSNKAEVYVKQLFDESSIDSLTYHTLEHTSTVVQKLKDACYELSIHGDDYEIIITAGWFHDVGYLYQNENHELKSI
jgi:predicted metal-dependent HD superfamily phosphohydrolase